MSSAAPQPAVPRDLVTARRDQIASAYARAPRPDGHRLQGVLAPVIPELIDAVGEAVAHGATDAARARLRRIAMEHARGLGPDASLSLDELLVEYRILARAITNALRRARVVTDDIEDAIADAIHLAIAGAVGGRDDRDRDPVLAKIESHALLDEVLMLLPVGVSITDARTGKGLFQNAEATRLTDRSVTLRNSLEDYAKYSAIHPDGRAYTAADYPTTRAIRNGEIIRDEAMRYRKDDDSLITLSVSSRPLRDRDGNIILAITSFHDITEREEARHRIAASEAALREVNERLRLIADSVPVHLVLVDREERVQFMNASAAAMWGRDPDAAIGLALREVVGEDRARALHANTERVLAGEAVSFESAFASADGGSRTFLTTYSPYRGADGAVRGFVATGTDITQREQDEERLRVIVGELRDEREVRERFVAALTHDLRTPLSAARMASELIVRLVDEPARVQQLAGRITYNIDRIDRMIRDLLDVNLLRAGRNLPIEPVDCDLAALARSTIDELSTIHGNRFVVRAPTSIVGHWDCDAIRRIVENLCGNAVKYGAPDRIITVTVATEPAAVRLEVHNEGRPIAEADRPELFEVFRRLDGVRATGWGLGLALVKGLVEAHRGSVTVESSAEAGTTFRVTLPRTP